MIAGSDDAEAPRWAWWPVPRTLTWRCPGDLKPLRCWVSAGVCRDAIQTALHVGDPHRRRL